MEDLKVRYYITPSSLGSYFGVGFNSPIEQFEIDSAQEESVFDQDSLDRMALGTHLEDATLNFFEYKLGIEITDRNEEVKWGLDGKMKYAIDGKTHFQGRDMVVENKISNSNSYLFTENLGYHFQCQAYMLAEDMEAALLCGLYQGRPVYTIIERNEEMIEDIKEMTDFVVSCLMGYEDFDNYPTHLLEKYSSSVSLEPIENLSDRAIEYYTKYAELKEEEKDINDRLKALKALYQDLRTPEAGIYEDDTLKLRVTTATRRGGIDILALKMDYPNIDFDKYTKPDTTYSVIKASIKKEAI